MSLCRFHHRKVHEGGIEVQMLDDGAVRFLRSDGTAVDSVAPGYTQPLADWKQLPAAHEERGIRIDARTAVTRWDGVRMDYGLGVEVLLQQAKREKRVAPNSAE